MTATVVDIRSHREQSREALKSANAQRMGVAAARRGLVRGSLTLKEALSSEQAAGLRVFEALLALPGCSDVKMRRIVNGAGGSSGARYALAVKRLRELAPSQRSALLSEAQRVLGRKSTTGASRGMVV